MFRALRIVLLLGILLMAGGITYWERWLVSQWSHPLTVVIYPVNGDGSDNTQRYIDGLTANHFQGISTFLAKQGERYWLKRLPMPVVHLGHQTKLIPPSPAIGSSGVYTSLLGSLKLRYFVFRNTPFFDNLGKIRIFVVYHAAEGAKPLQHSLGLQKGLVGLVHAFSVPEQDDQNNIVITHEILHTLGATDKYGANNQPIHPDGFGEPEASRLYPQKTAEIMAGRIAISPTETVMPNNLNGCVIGYKTAHQINW